jgi:hypothetical protein
MVIKAATIMNGLVIVDLIPAVDIIDVAVIVVVYAIFWQSYKG